MATRRSIISGSRRSVSASARKAFQIEGIEEIQANLARVLDEVTGEQAKDVYYEAGKILRDAARAKAPYDTGRVKGTHLRDAIFVDRGEKIKPNVLVGVRYKAPGAPHAHLIEYGSHKAPAQPYMRPAISGTASRIGKVIEQGLRKVIENAPKKT